MRTQFVVSDAWRVQLYEAIDADDTELIYFTGDIPVGQSLTITTPCHMFLDAESLYITDVEQDSPENGLTTMTIERGQGTTTAASHAAGALLTNALTAAMLNQIIDDLWAMKRVASDLLGDASDGVIRLADNSGLKVVPVSPVSTSVKVQVGSGKVSGEPIGLNTETTVGGFTAPTAGNERIDIVQISYYGTPTRKAGTPAVIGSASAPSVDANNMKLAEVYVPAGSTGIYATNEAGGGTNGYITDSRTEVYR